MNRTDYTRRAAPLAPTARQLEIWHLIAEGLPAKRIEQRLGLAEGTVKEHTRLLYQRIGVRSRSEAIAAWYKRAA